jgi:hypothetical protein
MNAKKTNAGDVFQIPIDQEKCACGQILFIDHAKFPLYIVVFRPAFLNIRLPDLNSICGSEIALLGGTMDTRFKYGYWTILGNTDPIIDRIPKPAFKTVVSGKPIVEDFFGKFIREATPKDIEFYDNWTSFSPMSFEMAIKSIHGEADWLPAFDQLLIEHAKERAN